MEIIRTWSGAVHQRFSRSFNSQNRQELSMRPICVRVFATTQLSTVRCRRHTVVQFNQKDIFSLCWSFILTPIRNIYSPPHCWPYLSAHLHRIQISCFIRKTKKNCHARCHWTQHGHQPLLNCFAFVSNTMVTFANVQIITLNRHEKIRCVLASQKTKNAIQWNRWIDDDAKICEYFLAKNQNKSARTDSIISLLPWHKYPIVGQAGERKKQNLHTQMAIAPDCISRAHTVSLALHVSNYESKFYIHANEFERPTFVI